MATIQCKVRVKGDFFAKSQRGSVAIEHVNKATKTILKRNTNLTFDRQTYCAIACCMEIRDQRFCLMKTKGKTAGEIKALIKVKKFCLLQRRKP